jgi:hypothetical protein
LTSKFGLKYDLNLNEKCIILLNGSSAENYINEKGFTNKGFDFFCVNGFAASEIYPIIKPKRYIILDENMFRYDFPTYIKIFDNIEKQTNWDMDFFVPQFIKIPTKIIEQLKRNNHIKIVRYNYVVYKGFQKLGHYFYKKNLAMPKFNNVAGVCLMLSISLNYKKILLLGADHNWHKNLFVDEKNILYSDPKHFYQEYGLKPLYKDYLDKSKGTFKMHEILYIFARTFESYHIVNEYSKSLGKSIYNGEQLSFIDAFEKIELEKF